MRIGIMPGLDPSGGGVYQYSLTMLRALHEWKERRGGEDDIVILAGKPSHPILSSLNGRNWTVIPLENPPPPSRQMLNLLRRAVGEGPHRQAWRWLREATHHRQTSAVNPDMVRAHPDVTARFLQSRAELMLYPVPQSLSFEVGIPYVMAIHDLQHRLQPEFPEVSANGEWELREYLFRNGARYATLLLADSDVGKEDIIQFYGPYGVTPDRIKVLPFLPACYLGLEVSENKRQDIRTRYQLPERYLFYPAQFWPHKNHVRIVQALDLLKQRHHVKIPAVFCGSHSGGIRDGNFKETMSFAARLGLEKEIHYLGYVPDEDIAGIYAAAVALVMPTFFGPTNIPILEAWGFGCPVLTSDIRGIREQVQDAAVLVNPRSVESIADGIYRLWTDGNLTSKLADLGRHRLASYTTDDYERRLAAILEEAKSCVRSQNLRSAS
ncbi:MAG TPA: glycosyltransferase family 1 protein [Candidatus Saccharimonadales bacterium]|nr:glycosyltransferase family 1 protein [Candidatus Saccharimonadales bacterium]